MNDHWTTEAKLELIFTIFAGDETVAGAAEQHGLPRATIEGWKALYLAGARQAARVDKTSCFERVRGAIGRHPLRSVGIGLISTAALLLVSFSAGSDAQQSCDDFDPANLEICQFLAGEPAIANEVNSNFYKVLAWLEQKAGPTGTPDISTAGSIDCSGDVSAHGQVRTSTITIGENDKALSITGNGGGVIASFDESPDAGIDDQVSVDGDLSVTGKMTLSGALDWRHGETGYYPILPDNFCVPVPAGQTCPTGWNPRGVKWDTEDSDNADSKDGFIAWDCGNSASICMTFCCRGPNS